jgi:PAS domain S-box-containing protein
MSAHGSALLQALDDFLRMRETELQRVRRSQQRAFRAIYALVAAFGAVILFGSIMFGQFLLRRVDRPLSQLATVARRIEGGELEARVSEEQDAEFSALAATFNRMAASLGEALATARRSEESFRHLFDNNPLPMWVYDLETTRFVEVNGSAVDRYGYSREEFLAMRLADIRPPEDLPRLEEDLRKERPALLSSSGWRHRLKDGRIITVDITSHLLTFGGRPAALVVAQDVTRREQLEAQLRQSQKMEAVGQLTGGIAHDFNNLLSVILGNSQFALDRLSETDPARRDVAEVLEAGQRAAVLTRQLLAFSRKQILDPKVLNLNEVLDGMEGMLHRLLGEDIEIQTARAGALGNVMADAGQLEQVIVNLAVNARDAMPRGGKLTFETGNVDLDETYAEQHAAIEPGRYVRLSVTDTGAGMDEATRSRVFEPFFTTKEKGKGTGLGLAMVYGIVKQSEGYIWVYSEPAQGTTFKIYLPRVDAAVAAPAAARPERRATGHETILLVEDEAAVRRAAERILQRAGYTVLTAAGGPDALAVYQQHQGAIDLLLTDVVMPQMSGRELEQRFRALIPNLKVLFASGYADNAIVHSGVLDPGTHFIGKPFTLEELTRKVREVLDEG